MRLESKSRHGAPCENGTFRASPCGVTTTLCPCIRELRRWLENPFGTPPLIPLSEQLNLELS
jgi:hypothetical protein